MNQSSATITSEESVRPEKSYRSKVSTPTWLPASWVPCFNWCFDVGPRHPCRIKTRTVLRSAQFELALGAIVCLNIYVVIQEVDAQASGTGTPPWIKRMNWLFVCTFTCELAIRLFCSRLVMFKDPFCVLDFILISYDLMSAFTVDNSPVNASTLRIFRLAKVVRTVKLMKAVPELYLMVKGLLGAVRAVLWGTVLAGVLVILWSIIAVVWIHPLNKEIAQASQVYKDCDRCPHAFESVFKASITICQTIIAGDSWGLVAIPIIEEHPETLIFFFLVFTSLALATVNLILAVIVDSAQMARVKSVEELAKEKEKLYSKCKRVLRELCAGLDSDGDGKLSLDELEGGFSEIPEFGNQLRLLEIDAADIPVLFGMLDLDCSGDVSYEEFINEFAKMQINDIPSMMVNIRFYLTLIRRQLLDNSERLSGQVIAKIDEHEALAEKHMLDLMKERFRQEEVKISELISNGCVSHASHDFARSRDGTVFTASLPGDEDWGNWELQSASGLVPHAPKKAFRTMDVKLPANKHGNENQWRVVESACQKSLETLISLVQQFKGCVDAKLDDSSCREVLGSIRTYALELASRTEANPLIEANIARREMTWESI